MLRSPDGGFETSRNICLKRGGGAHLLLKEGEPVVEAHGRVRAGSHSHCGDASELVEHVERELRFRKDLRSHATSKEHTVSNTGPQLGTNKRAEEWLTGVRTN